MKILVINCGSSSLKYQLFDMDDCSVMAKGICERIGIEGSKLKHTAAGKDAVEFVKDMPDHKVAVGLVLDTLVSDEYGVIASVDEISAVGHRVLHAGQKYSDSIIVNEDVKAVIRECFDLGPLHNPANLIGIEACEHAMPNTPNIAVFDTAFHQTMPEKAYMYAIPYEYYEKYGVRRYGFHGTSHSYVSNKTYEYGLEKENSKVILMSPRGETFNQKLAHDLTNNNEHLILICGHYEGVDSRVNDYVDELASIGDYILTGGEIPACIVVDAVSRLVDGVLSDSECYEKESISSGMLEYPQYTRPYEFHNVCVPDILISGNHAKIDAWRREQAFKLTKERRPDLLKNIDERRENDDR